MNMENKKMRESLAKLARSSKKRLPPDLRRIVDEGFVEQEGCIFISSLRQVGTNATADNFVDRTGYECFINSLHIDDYVSEDYLEYACIFVEELFGKWRSSISAEKALAIISSDEMSVTVKLHVARGESWFGDDLEKYEEAILIVDSSVVRVVGNK